FDEGCAFNGISPLENDTEEHAALALDAARKSMVLLKNDGLLPLKKDGLRTIAVVGPVADSQAVLEGNYNGISSRYTTFLEGIREAFAGSARVIYAEGSKLDRDRDSNLSQYHNDRLAEAIAAAKEADVTILCVGLDATLEGEEGDRGNVYFSGDKKDLLVHEVQRPLVEAMEKHAKKLVTVVASGSALDVRAGHAILWAGYPGQTGGKALADILLGEVSPSGKLPITFYRNDDPLPEFTDYSMKNRTYRYHEAQALYPFGYGLSYASFAYSEAAYEAGAARVTIRNEGSVDAEEIGQVYVKADSKDAPRNPRLSGFRRVALKAGEEKRVIIPLDHDLFTVIDNEGHKVQAQSAALYIGGSQPDERSAQLLGKAPLSLKISR
ncbi:MAG: glycoside hydrolase family 3 protein, partial [Clostridiales bacterium]|nr:glycoside hydrolase family 3 protein [Clostridiales bacterium]